MGRFASGRRAVGKSFAQRSVAVRPEKSTRTAQVDAPNIAPRATSDGKVRVTSAGDTRVTG